MIESDPTCEPGAGGPPSAGQSFVAGMPDPSVAGSGGLGQGDDRAAAAYVPPRDAVPGYRLERELSRGGQGVVYLATQLSTGRTVAVKVMREGPFAGPRDRARFDREAQVLLAIDHPNVVPVLDRGTTPDGSY